MQKSESAPWGIHAIESFIDRTTLYRLMLYCLLALFAVAVIFSAADVLPYAFTKSRARSNGRWRNFLRGRRSRLLRLQAI